MAATHFDFSLTTTTAHSIYVEDLFVHSSNGLPAPTLVFLTQATKEILPLEIQKRNSLMSVDVGNYCQQGRLRVTIFLGSLLP